MTVKHKDFVRALIFWLAVLLLFLAGSELLISCKAKKPLIDSKISEVISNEKTVVKENNEKSLAVSDTVFVPVGNIITGSEDCDKKCNDALQKQLQGLNTKKKSGNNETGFYYDKYKKMLVAYSNLGETNSRLRDSISQIYKSDHKSEIKPVLVPAEFSKEEKFNLWVGRLFWVGVFVGIGLRIRKKIPA